MTNSESKLRIAVGAIFNETSAFLTTRADIQHWKNTYVLHGADLFALASTTTEEAGVLAVCANVGVEVVPLMAARSVSSGPSTDACYAELKESLLRPLREAGPVDGVALVLHGAMTAISEDDPEGDILQSVRAIVGDNVPIVSTLDLHAHITPKMVQNADGLIAFAHYPHDDTFTTGERCATLLLKIVRGEVRPAMAMAKVPVLSSGVRGMTFGDAPMAHMTQRARELEQQAGILSVSVLHVQPSNDLPGMGSGGLVITDGDVARAENEARSIAEEYWSRRRQFEPEIVSVEEAVRCGRAVESGPVILVDTADCTGGGAAGDSVALLKQLLELGVSEPTFVMVVDPEAAHECVRAGIGASVSLMLGHKLDPSWGRPIAVTGIVRHLLDGDFIYTGGAYGGTTAHMGLSAVLAINGIQVLIMSKPTYDWADEQFRAAGMDVRYAKFIGVKNPMNYNFAYKGIAKASYVVDTPGPTPATMSRLPYKRMQRPFFPLDTDIPGLQPTVFSHQSHGTQRA